MAPRNLHAAILVLSAVLPAPVSNAISRNGFELNGASIPVAEIGGIARAYPIKILNWHEIVNDAADLRRVGLALQQRHAALRPQPRIAVVADPC